MPRKSTPEDFYRHTTQVGECIEWQGKTQQDGYGCLGYQRKHWLAHRLSWTLNNGPIPDGICVCHRCDNPRCVRVDHLFLGSHAENMADMKTKGRRRGINTCDQNGRAKLTSAQVQEIKQRYVRGSSSNGQVSLAAEFGVSQSAISCIIRDETWR